MKTKLLKLLVVMTISITAIFALGITASAAQVGDLTITLTEGGGDPVVDTDYTYAGNVLTIKSSAAMTISGTTTTDRIEVANGVSAKITLAGVNIDVSSQSDTAAFKIADDSTGNVTITLADGTTNTLKSGYECAGLQKNGEYSDTLGTLTIQGGTAGTGILNATTGDAVLSGGAGIGGGKNKNSANIEIKGGKINAISGSASGGAGIGGGGNGGSGSYITISGGEVTATGSGDEFGDGGAGIGGGVYGSGSNIEISGGVVIANGGGDNYGGAGIGGGYIGSSSNIKISGGTVKASSIGCTPTDGTANATPVYLFELNVDGTSAVTINGKAYPTKHVDENKLYVYLPAGDYTVANGNSQKLYTIADNGTASEVVVGTAFKITGTDLVYGTDYTYPADTGILTILSGKAMTISGTTTTDTIIVADSVSANITLAGVNIDVFERDYKAAFQIADDSTGNVTITLADGTTNTLKSGADCAALQKNGGYISENQGKLIITGNGTLNAEGCAAGIGGGSLKSSANIEIKGGKINALSRDDGVRTAYASYGSGSAGIGGGSGGNGSYITISGGEVTATGSTNSAGSGGAGIGGGFNGSGSNIKISGGTVEAQGGYRAAGIGGGANDIGSYITISGGTVTAEGADGGAGIGGGRGDSKGKGNGGSNIKISGGVVIATSEGSGAGIGGGNRGSADNITISGGSVKVVADTVYQNCVPAVIGQGVQYDSGVYSNGAEVTPTDGTDNVYLLELDVDGTSAVTANGKAYPTKHFDENKVYIYLPAKTAQTPNEVTIGTETTKYCYDTVDEKWLKVVEPPAADETEFVYNGKEQTYALAENENYTITGNKQTNAGTYTVTAALKDGYIWNDGETTKEYTFTIAKADPVVTVTTDKSSNVAGKAIAVTTTAKHPTNNALTDVPAPVLTYKVGANGAETAFTGSFVIPEGTADGAIITITAKTAESVNYNAATATATVVVTDCKHTDKTTAWTTDSTSHWHVCNYCSAEIDKAEHISDGGKVTTPATATTDGVRTYSCTACGYVIKTEAIPATDNSGSVEPDVSKPEESKPEESKPEESKPVVTTPSNPGMPSWVVTGAPVTTTKPAATTTTAPVDEDEDIEPEDDADTTKPADSNEPQIKGESGKTGWDVIADEIADADDGDKIVVDMNGATEVPKSIFKQIKGKDIDLVIELDNGFTWTINGESVTKPMDIDLGVSERADNIPVEVINKLTGERNYLEITLSHEGDFGFTATLTVDMGDENEGLYANLYWYTSGGMEFICTDKINSKGMADLTFTHASEYVIVIDETNHGKRVEEVEDDKNSEVDGDTDVSDDENDDNPPTGVVISFAGIAVSAMAAAIARKRRK